MRILLNSSEEKRSVASDKTGTRSFVADNGFFPRADRRIRMEKQTTSEDSRAGWKRAWITNSSSSSSPKGILLLHPARPDGSTIVVAMLYLSDGVLSFTNETRNLSSIFFCMHRKRFAASTCHCIPFHRPSTVRMPTPFRRGRRSLSTRTRRIAFRSLIERFHALESLATVGLSLSCERERERANSVLRVRQAQNMTTTGWER